MKATSLIFEGLQEDSTQDDAESSGSAVEKKQDGKFYKLYFLPYLVSGIL